MGCTGKLFSILCFFEGQKYSSIYDRLPSVYNIRLIHIQEVIHMEQTQFLRNLIIETPSSPGNFAKVATAIGQLEGDMGDIQTIKIGTLSTIRDISIQCRNEEHFLQIVDAVNDLDENIIVRAVTDDVLQAHEGGKIDTKGRVEIRSLGDLQTRLHAWSGECV